MQVRLGTWSVGMCVCVCGSQWCSEVVFFRLPLGQTNCVAVIKRCPANTGPTHAIETTGHNLAVL